MQEGSPKAIIAAITAAFLANLGIAVAKFTGFVLTGSDSIYIEPDASRETA